MHNTKEARGRGGDGGGETHQEGNNGIPNQSQCSAKLSFVTTTTAKESLLCCHGDDLCTRSIPVGTAQPGGMLGQVQPLHLPVHHPLDVGLRDAP